MFFWRLILHGLLDICSDASIFCSKFLSSSLACCVPARACTGKRPGKLLQPDNKQTSKYPTIYGTGDTFELLGGYCLLQSCYIIFNRIIHSLSLRNGCLSDHFFYKDLSQFFFSKTCISTCFIKWKWEVLQAPRIVTARSRSHLGVTHNTKHQLVVGK